MANRIAALLLLLVSTLALGQVPARSVAITIDDMPAVAAPADAAAEKKDVERIVTKLMKAFKRHHVPVIGFVNQQIVERNGLTQSNTDLLGRWLDAGYELGNHTYSHPKFSDLTLEQFEQNTVDGEKTIAPLLAKRGKKLRFFRHPFLDTGGTREKKEAFEAFLKSRGYETATVTMGNDDWMMERVYLDALQHHDKKKARKVREAYLAFTSEAIEKNMALSKFVIGREFPQVMLMHANHLNADCMNDVLKIFEKHGYKFVSLADAQSDPAYQSADNFDKPYGQLWQQRWAYTKGIKPDPSLAPDAPKWLWDEYNRLAKVGY